MIIVLFLKIVKRKIKNLKITSDLLQITSDFSKSNLEVFFLDIVPLVSKITSDIISDI